MPPNPLRRLPRRLQIALPLAAVSLLALSLLSLTASTPHHHLPAGLHRAVFASRASAPPITNYATLLPPLSPRTPIYTYFDPTPRRQDAASQQAEQDLLQIWRRAWWSRGFVPQVLGVRDARRHKLWSQLQTLEMTGALRGEVERLMAWTVREGEFVEGEQAVFGDPVGALCHWLAVPMGGHHDGVLPALRMGAWSWLARVEGLGDGLYLGAKEEVEDAILGVLQSSRLSTAETLDDALPEEYIETKRDYNSTTAGIAFYSAATLATHYPSLSTLLADPTTRSQGLSLLPQLITSHLHLTFLNAHPLGLSLPIPFPKQTTTLQQPLLTLAQNLTTCPPSPEPASCPPNRPSCRPCISSSLSITAPPVLRNESGKFTLLAYPHPYTLASLLHNRTTLDLAFVVRKTARDAFTLQLTREWLGTGLSALARLPSIYALVLDERTAERFLFFPAESLGETEEAWQEEIDWSLGFPLPREGIRSGKSETPVPGPERRPKKVKDPYSQGDGRAVELSAEQRGKEEDLLQRARQVVLGGARLRAADAEDVAVGKEGKGEYGGEAEAADPARTLAYVEAWNLADAEVWHFLSALAVRRKEERREWWAGEEARRRGTGGEGIVSGVFGRWVGSGER